MNITDATLNDPSREGACGAPKIQAELRDIAIRILLNPRCAADLQIAWLLFYVDVAIESDLLPEFVVYASCFPDWLQRAEEGAGVVAEWVM